MTHEFIPIIDVFVHIYFKALDFFDAIYNFFLSSWGLSQVTVIECHFYQANDFLEGKHNVLVLVSFIYVLDMTWTHEILLLVVPLVWDSSLLQCGSVQ